MAELHDDASGKIFQGSPEEIKRQFRTYYLKRFAWQLFLIAALIAIICWFCR